MENAGPQFVQEKEPLKYYDFINDSQTMWRTTYISGHLNEYQIFVQEPTRFIDYWVIVAVCLI